MPQNDETRRSFLRQLFAGSAIAATAAGAVLNSKKAGAKENKAEQKPDDILYRETDAFKNYYKSLR